MQWHCIDEAGLFFRLHPKRVHAAGRIFSKTASTVDSGKERHKDKKSAPQSSPIGMWLKTLGSVTKINLGPEPALHVVGKTGGKNDEAGDQRHKGVPKLPR